MILTDAPLSGRHAVVLGGSGGIGRAIASTLAELGADVSLAARRLERCEELAGELAEQHGVRTHAVRADVSIRDHIVEAIASAREALGPIGVLVVNAGTFTSGEVWEIRPERWRKVFAVNVDAPFFAVQEAFEDLRDTKGTVIFVSSAGGLMSYRRSSSKIVAYTTSKAALLHLTRDLAAQLADFGIRVNAIAPGSIDSGLTETLSDEQRAEMESRAPLGRLGTPEDLCGAVAYLATDMSKFVTGQALIVDGGLTLV